MKKELDLQVSNMKNVTLEKENLFGQIKDIKIQHENEIKLMKNKFERDFENQLEDEKQALVLQIEEANQKYRKLMRKTEHLQNQIKKQAGIQQKLNQFCNSQITSLATAHFTKLESSEDDFSFVQKQNNLMFNH